MDTLPCRCNSVGKWESSCIANGWISRLTLIGKFTILFIRRIGTIFIKCAILKTFIRNLKTFTLDFMNEVIKIY